ERLEASEATWPCRKNVVACAAVCRTWREMCKEIVKNPEFCGKITFPVSLKQPGPRDGTMQCFIKRDRSTQTYYLYLCLTSAVLVENGKFLLSAKRICRATCTEYIISMNANSISRSTDTYIGKMRSNFLGTKFVMYDTQPPYNASSVSHSGTTSRRFYSKKGSTKVPCSTYSIAQVSYELNVLGTRGPRRMRARFSDVSIGGGPAIRGQALSDGEDSKDTPLILRNKVPRWHEQLQCWCLNFRGRVTVASVKNFQLTAAVQPAAGAPTPPHPAPAPPPEHDKVILQFGKVAKDMFTMDYRYPLSAFQAFALSLSSFDTKLACE
uniref:Tubby C-terminal domain-containing protein n=1 Tax=Aegilops tauschii subsp. strangulata TaxID=200361 RepID=A0A453HM28_AEGTS